MVNILAALISPLSGLAKAWMEKKALKQKEEMAIRVIEAKGRIKAAEKLAQTTADYDTYAIQQMSKTWKDEYLILMWSFPIILTFLTPYLQLALQVYYSEATNPQDVNLIGTLQESWNMVAGLPGWYQSILIGMIIATFGLRWAAGGFKIKGVNGG